MTLYRLGFDIDEVITTTSDVLVDHAMKEYGVIFNKQNYGNYEKFVGDAYIPGDPEKSKEIGLKLIEDVNNPYIQNEGIPIKDCPKILRRLKMLGHKIFFVSARPIGTEEHTKKWLDWYGIQFDGLYHLGRNIPKGVVCDELELDLFVEDEYTNLIKIFETRNHYKKGLILMNKIWNEEIDTSKYPFIRLNDWTEIEHHITTYME